MLKKLLKAVTMFTLLVGCYFVYVHAFAVVVDQLRANRRRKDDVSHRTFEFQTAKPSPMRASAFGRDHWSAANDLAYRYYNAERGFWMYAKQVWRIVEENGVKYDGKRVRMAPFALISISSDGKNTKTIVSDEAIFDLNEPLSLSVNPDGEPLKIKHAWIERNVLIRDDRSTPNDPSDDMRVVEAHRHRIRRADAENRQCIRRRHSRSGNHDQRYRDGDQAPVHGPGAWLVIGRIPGRGIRDPEAERPRRDARCRQIGHSPRLISGLTKCGHQEPGWRSVGLHTRSEAGRDRAGRTEPTPLDVRCDG